MKSRLLAAAMALGLSFVGWSQSATMAGIIDTLPPNHTGFANVSGGPDTIGGTFTADNVTLASFTIAIAHFRDGGVFRAVVLATAAGIPTDEVLWQSADTIVPDDPSFLVFTPNLAITPGNQYFIGVDTGLLTEAAGGSLFIGGRDDNPLAGGVAFDNVDGLGFEASPDIDIAARIVMVPEPAALALFGLGLAGLGFARRRKTA